MEENKSGTSVQDLGDTLAKNTRKATGKKVNSQDSNNGSQPSPFSPSQESVNNVNISQNNSIVPGIGAKPKRQRKVKKRC